MKFTSIVFAFLIGLCFACTNAIAGCMPPMNFSKIVADTGPKGDFVMWWCDANTYHVVACARSTCSLAGSRQAVSDWLKTPTADTLTFGTDPITNTKLKAVWYPSFYRMNAIRPTL